MKSIADYLESFRDSPFPQVEYPTPIGLSMNNRSNSSAQLWARLYTLEPSDDIMIGHYFSDKQPIDEEQPGPPENQITISSAGLIASKCQYQRALPTAESTTA